MKQDLEITNEFKRANRLAGKSDFLLVTGKAGTGKTTWTNWFIQKNKDKNILICAPTGTAAIQAGGETIHSLFRINPYGTPDSTAREKEQAMENFFDRDEENRCSQIELIRSADLLLIDEISMVTATLLDQLDQALRYYRGNDKDDGEGVFKHSQPFGNLPVVAVGDLFQLPPIEGNNFDAFQKKYGYDSAWFFDSIIFKRVDVDTVEFTRIFRQEDEEFMNALNSIRTGDNLAKALTLINERVVEDRPEEATVLASTNNTVNKINLRGMKQFDQDKKYTAYATISGDFDSSEAPVETELTLAEGARVMVRKNIRDEAGVLQAVNGDIGNIKDIDLELAEISVEIFRTGNRVKIEKNEWEKHKHTLSTQEDKDGNTKKTIKRETVGTFKQYPLTIAYAITIHKSQGMTIPQLVFNPKNLFADGMCYVALSRAVSLDELYLTAPIDEEYVRVSAEAKKFYERYIMDGKPILRQAADKLSSIDLGDEFELANAGGEIQ